MKHSLLLLFAVLLAVTAPLAPARADDSVSIDFFYDALSPYGDWIYTDGYGYVWQPLASQQPGWSPYADGSWAFTDAGWTWISNEDFGWLTYHYGRWIRMQQSWLWVPGYEWAPAWVSWRQTQGQIGWAPLPPEAAWAPDIGFGGWTDSYYDVGPSYYNFVPIGLFASNTSLRPLILDRSRNFNYYDQSVNITHTSYRKDVVNHIFVGGPDPRHIDSFGSNHVRRLSLRRDDEGFRRNWLDNDRRGNGGPPRGAGSSSRIEQGQLFIAAPSIRREASHALPSRVREFSNKPEVDRGWHGMANAQGADVLRQKQRDELARTRPPQLPEKNQRPVTSTVPPPAFGRNLEPHERKGDARKGEPGATAPKQPGPRPVKEEARKPGTPKNPMPDGPPGIPGKAEAPAVRPGTVPGDGPPRREPQGSDPQPGQKPGRRPHDNNAPAPGGAPQVKPGFPPTPQGKVPQRPGKQPGEDRAPAPGGAPQMKPGFPPTPQGNVPQHPGKRPGEDRAPAPGGAPQMKPGFPPTPQGNVPQVVPPQRQAPQPPVVPQQRTPQAPAMQPGNPGRRHQEPPPGQPPAERPRMQPQPRAPSPAPAPPQANGFPQNPGKKR